MVIYLISRRNSSNSRLSSSTDTKAPTLYGSSSALPQGKTIVAGLSWLCQIHDTARRKACQNHPVEIDRQRVVGQYGLNEGKAVVDGGREAVARPESVLEAGDAEAVLIGEEMCLLIVHTGVPDSLPATMYEEEDEKLCVCIRRFVDKDAHF
ncbi:hypothetical protein HD806DRAFT_530079 [Xylariaceae sp. AK1471]|nr:hypothetical protein HD806DRAFT_530079 [Xylariaceae sp. AK1471]